MEIPLRYDGLAKMEVEDYPDLIEAPVYTPKGCPIMLTYEDACPYGEMTEGRLCVDCGSCRFYRQAPNTLLGVCGHEKNGTVQKYSLINKL